MPKKTKTSPPNPSPAKTKAAEKAVPRKFAIVQNGKIIVTDAAEKLVASGQARFAKIADCGVAGSKIHPKYIHSNSSQET